MFKPVGFGIGAVLVVLALVAIVLAVTKPGPPDHYLVIEGELFPAMRKAIAPKPALTEGMGAFERMGGALGNAMVRIAMDRAIRGARERLEYHDYALFSTVSLDGKTVTLGVLGHVRLMVEGG